MSPPVARSIAVTVRTLLWQRYDGRGSELCSVDVRSDRLTAYGTALGLAELAYRIDYRVETSAGFATSSCEVHATGAGWSRRLVLRGHGAGHWEVDASATGPVAMAPPGGASAMLAGALDIDIGYSPMTNTLPVRRLALPDAPAGEAYDVVVAWIDVPSLVVQPMRQTYTALGADAARFSASGFSAELALDDLGLVTDYPELATAATP
jgi:hypothetical protein